MKIKLPPKKEEEKGPAFTYEDWGNVLLANEDLAREGSSVNHMRRLQDYSEGELKKYFPDLEDYRNALDIRKRSMTANIAARGTQGQMYAGQRGVNGERDEEISMAGGNRHMGNAGNGGVGVPQTSGAGTVDENRYPEIDMSDTDLESSSPEAVEAWINEHPNQAWRKAYQFAAYRIATGQEQVPQMSETPRYGDQAQLAYAGEMGGVGDAGVGEVYRVQKSGA